MKKFLLPFGLLCGLSAPLSAENIVIPVGQQAADKQAINRPLLGTNKDQVRERFGDPKDWVDPVGVPPISSWEYQDFIVYFEYNQVLHSVLKRTRD